MTLKLIIILLAAFVGLPFGSAVKPGPMQPEEAIEIEIGEDAGGVSIHP